MDNFTRKRRTQKRQKKKLRQYFAQIENNLNKGNSGLNYTDEEIEFIHQKIGSLSVVEIAEILKRSVNGLKAKLIKLNIRTRESYHGHNYISESDFIKEIVKFPGITKSIYFNLKLCGFIKVNSITSRTNFITDKNYNEYIKFFSNYTHPEYFFNVLFKDIPEQTKHTWIARKNIDIFTINERQTNKHWISNKSIKLIESLDKDWLCLKHISKESGYNKESIRRLMKNNKISTNHIRFCKQIYFHKDILKELKEYKLKIKSDKTELLKLIRTKK